MADPEIATVPMLRGSVDPEGDIRRALLGRGRAQDEPDPGLDVVAGPRRGAADRQRRGQGVPRRGQGDRTTARPARRSSGSRRSSKDAEARRSTTGRKEIESLHQPHRRRRRGAAQGPQQHLARRLPPAQRGADQRRDHADRGQGQARPAPQREAACRVRPQDDEAIKQAVTEEFYADPRVAALQVQREKAQAKLKEAERLARNPSDPARHRTPRSRSRRSTTRSTSSGPSSSRGLRRKVTATPVDDSLDRIITDAEANLAALKTQEETLSSKLEKVRIERQGRPGRACSSSSTSGATWSGPRRCSTRSRTTSSSSSTSRSSPVARIDLDVQGRARRAGPTATAGSSYMAAAPAGHRPA